MKKLLAVLAVMGLFVVAIDKADTEQVQGTTESSLAASDAMSGTAGVKAVA